MEDDLCVHVLWLTFAGNGRWIVQRNEWVGGFDGILGMKNAIGRWSGRW